ncbi:hypothetical protein [Pseudaminobacter soli (ex Li et al. 2025)]|uniref:Uncharacterized protein n=1 Tax=Pseudaminobacter soli (ex Li et al. 2025) TaxID=1295366 RepID=A0A2P7SNI3_9HYPH|nr:hypothetical protein [Mesorhizobium soli]PSJ64042.1 hypothetical protein C7I85_02735 [Mesorhizobium soli]
MRKMLFAFAAVLLGSGAALADSAPTSVIVNPHSIVRETFAQARITGDTAPEVKIVKPQSRVDFKSAAAIQAPHYGTQFNSRDGDAAPPMN